ncbi:MAG: WbqC family protein [Hymenobacteraceae bacterium]|nr:WbqC family protein [Hymenobacteraceae bacterium]
MPLLTELHFCPPAAWFAAALTAPGGVLLERHEHYQKQTFRNRALILTAQGPKPLTVPVRGGASQHKQRADEILIDTSHDWARPHCRTLQSAYNRTPYFLYYADPLLALLLAPPPTLYALNRCILDLLLGWLAPALPVAETNSWQAGYTGREVLDRRQFYTPDAPPDRMRVSPYPQAFGAGFVSGLSILDVLFALGPGTAAFLRATAAPSVVSAPAD